MDRVQINAQLKQERVGDREVATAFGVDRKTVWRWLAGKAPMIRAISDLAFPAYFEKRRQERGESSTQPDGAPAVWERQQQSRRSLHIPLAVQQAKCPRCGGAVYVRGPARRYSELGPVFTVQCATHHRHPERCATRIFHVNTKGKYVELPRTAATRPWKRFRYPRPMCPREECGLEMRTGRVLVRPALTAKGTLRSDKVQRFFCAGIRWGKHRHARIVRYFSAKGAEVNVARGRQPLSRGVADLPLVLRRNYPRCEKCSRLMSRGGVRRTPRLGVILRFVCQRCRTSKEFLASGKPKPPRRMVLCQVCGAGLVRGPSARTLPQLECFRCTNRAVRHCLRQVYRHRKNGRWYRLLQGGRRPRPVLYPPDQWK